MRLIRPIPLTLAVLLGLGGFACSNKTGPVAPDADRVTSELYPKVTILSPLDRDRIVVDYAGIIIDPPTESTPLRIQVPARSTAQEQFLTQYRFSWFDAEGRRLSDTGWAFQPFDVGLRRELSGVATRLGAVDWRLEIRLAR